MSQQSENIGALRKWLHAIANGLMPVGGTVTLMKLGKVQADTQQLDKLEASINKLNRIVNDAREALKEMDDADNDDSDLLYEVTYMSKFTGNWGDSDAVNQMLNDIEEKCLKNNAELSIGGFLLPCNGYFLQRLEGEEQTVKQLINRIFLDPRHCQISILSKGGMEQLNFKKWQSLRRFDVKQDWAYEDIINKLLELSQTQCSSDHSLAALNVLLDRHEHGKSH